MKIRLSPLLPGFIGLATGATAQTNLLLNPSFEAGYAANGSYGYFGYANGGDPTLITDWNYYEENPAGGFVVYQTGEPYYTAPYDGSANLRLNEGAGPSNGVFQNFTATVGQSYAVSVQAARALDGYATLNLRLEVQTADGLTVLNQATASINSSFYSTVTFNFTATSADLRYVIRDVTAAGTGATNDLVVDSASLLLRTTRTLGDALELQSVTFNTDGLNKLSFGELTAATFGGLAGSDGLSLTNAAGTPAPVALTVGATNASTLFTGALSGTGSLTKTGTGTFTLSGANTYSGATTVDAGTLKFTRLASFYNGDTAQGVQLVVNSGATATFNVGGADGFTATDIATLVTGATFQNGSRLGLDTTSAIGGSFAYSAALADSAPGASLALVKLGTGTLTLSGANTYSGGTVIQGGTLAVSSDANLGDAAGAVTLGSQGTLLATSSFATNRTLGSLSYNQAKLAVGAGATLTWNGAVTATSLSKTGGGTLILGGANSQSSTSLYSGTLVLAHDQALPGTLYLEGGTLAGDGSLRTIPGTTYFNSNGAGGSTIGGSSDLTFTQSFEIVYTGDVINLTNTATTTFAGPTFGRPTFSAYNIHYGAESLRIANAGPVFISSLVGDSINFDYNYDEYNPVTIQFVKSGPGPLTLSAANTYTGGAVIEAGTLIAANTSGSATGAGPVTIQSGATLSGTGVISGPVTVQSGGLLSPGASPGLLTLGDGSILAGTTLIEIAGTTRGVTGGYDALDFGLNGTGSVILGGELQVAFFGGYVPTGDASFLLFKASSFGGGFAPEDLSLPSVAGYAWNTSRLNTEGILELAAIPEPSTVAALAGLATLALAALRRPRRL